MKEIAKTFGNDVVTLAIGGAGVVALDKKDQLLAVELIRHFMPTWAPRLAAEPDANARALAYVHSLFEKLQVEHEILPAPAETFKFDTSATSAAEQQAPSAASATEQDTPAAAETAETETTEPATEPPITVPPGQTGRWRTNPTN